MGLCHSSKAIKLEPGSGQGMGSQHGHVHEPRSNRYPQNMEQIIPGGEGILTPRNLMDGDGRYMRSRPPSIIIPPSQSSLSLSHRGRQSSDYSSIMRERRSYEHISPGMGSGYSSTRTRRNGPGPGTPRITEEDENRVLFGNDHETSSSESAGLSTAPSTPKEWQEVRRA